MKVSTLIKKLQKLDQNAPVLVRGYEGGYNDIKGVTKRRLIKNFNEGTWYYGKHEDAAADGLCDYVGYELWGTNE